MTTAVKNGTSKSITIKVEPDEAYIPPRMRGDDWFDSSDRWSSWREYCDELAERLQGWPHLPRPGDLITDEEDAIHCISVMHCSDRDAIVIFIGERPEPVDEPTSPPTNGERRIPERVQTYQGEEKTIFLVENMQGDMRTLHALAQSVWKTLRDAEELRDWECADLMDHMVAELEQQRDRLDAIVDGYYGKDTA